ncbi:hypothetical protein [Bacteroides graminisolvens]|uniref:hypothetical protein n=1 Tax=Bacteroides graminisolvens TaxID=477666 RepID=UPI0023F1C3C2|nr:hypothetical protein [Bacteroides graminisolvens]MDD3211711.1 hypothetical protein [Bacteroides graminisolvens]
MYKPSFGSKGQIRFANEHEFYTLLGYLAKSDGSTSLVLEKNQEQGAWAKEVRIKIYVTNMPQIGQLTLTAGVGKIAYRINCNEFVDNILENHGFVYGEVQDIEHIRKLIPDEYQPAFDAGLKM